MIHFVDFYHVLIFLCVTGPRYRRPKEKKEKSEDEKRPRTAFSNDQLQRLKVKILSLIISFHFFNHGFTLISFTNKQREFNENRYLTEKRRLQLSAELGLNEAQIKIWFQNKR